MQTQNKDELRLAMTRTANREPVATNGLFTLFAEQQLARPQSDFEHSELPPATAAHVENGAELWRMRMCSTEGHTLGHLIVQIKNDTICAVHDLRLDHEPEQNGRLLVGGILASNPEPTRIIGINAQIRSFWQSMGVNTETLDPYNNTVFHWSDYAQAHTETERQSNALQSDLRSGRPDAASGPGLAATSERSGSEGQGAQSHTDASDQSEPELTESDLQFLDEFTRGLDDATDIYYQLGGRRSLTANKTALIAAEQFIREGRDAEQVRQKTGWHQGVDLQWRYEISDHDATLKLDQYTPDANGALHLTGPLHEYYEHPRLYAAYPLLRNIEVELILDPRLDAITASTTLPELMPDGVRPSTLKVHSFDPHDIELAITHELQHTIQYLEGFALGGNPTQLRQAAVTALNARLEKLEASEQDICDMTQIPASEIAHLVAIERERALCQETLEAVKKGHCDESINTAYLRLAGEKEARLSEQRMHLTPEQRQEIAPLLSQKEGSSLVLFADTDPQTLVSQFNLHPKAQVSFLPRQSLITLTKAADRSSFFHEIAHVFLRMEQLSANSQQLSPFQNKLLDYLGAESFEGITREQHETFAQGFERYLAEGPSDKAPQGVFATVKHWLSGVAKRIKSWGADLSPAAHSVYEQMLTPKDSNPTMVEQARRHEADLASQLIATGMYSQQEAQMSAAVVGQYAIAKAEQSPDMPTVNAVFDQMNLSVQAVAYIEPEAPQFDYDTFSLQQLIQQADQADQLWLRHQDLSDPAMNLSATEQHSGERGLQPTRL